MMQKAVKVTLLTEPAVFNPMAKVTAETIAFKEWIIPLEAYNALVETIQIQTYQHIESEVAKQFNYTPIGEVASNYIGFMRGKLQRKWDAEDK